MEQKTKTPHHPHSETWWQQDDAVGMLFFDGERKVIDLMQGRLDNVLVSRCAKMVKICSQRPTAVAE